MSVYTRCPACGRVVSVTKRGKYRAHDAVTAGRVRPCWMTRKPVEGAQRAERHRVAQMSKREAALRTIDDLEAIASEAVERAEAARKALAAVIELLADMPRLPNRESLEDAS